MKFKRSGGEWLEVQGPDDEILKWPNAAWDKICRTSDPRSLETDLPVLYKKDKQGRWREMSFSLSLDAVVGMPCLVKTMKTTGLKGRVWSSPIKPVGSKYYSDVIQERLIAAHKKKRDRDGWVEDKEDVALSEPMLLHHYNEYKSHLSFPALIMPKLNGIRATYKPSHGLLSRKRNPFSKLYTLESELKVLGMTVDGELWKPGCSLESIVSMVKGGSLDIELHIFERPQGGAYATRIATLIKELKRGNYPHIKVIPIAVVNSHEEIREYFETIKDLNGVDGAVVRNMNVKYEWDTRSKGVLKVKEVIHREYVVEAIRYDTDVLGSLIKFVFDAGEQGSFEYVPAWSKERRLEAYVNHLNGKEVFIGVPYTLEFREYTRSGLPKHIMNLQERAYE